MKNILKTGISIGMISGGIYYLNVRENLFPQPDLAQKLNWAISVTKFLLSNDLLWKEVSITSSDYKFLGEKIKNPIGLASGYDIDGEMIIGLQNLGFGYIEIGSISPQDRQTKSNYILNDNQSIDYTKEGYSLGLLKCKSNLTSLRKYNQITVPIGVSIIPNEETINYTPYLIDKDIENCIRELHTLADYIVLNLIGSDSINPQYQNSTIKNKEFITHIFEKMNLVKLEDLQNPQFTKIIKNTPILAKVQSDLDKNTLDHLLKQKVDGIILQKTTSQTDIDYLNIVREISQKKPVICVGQVNFNGQIKTRLNAGAQAIQFLSPFLINGPNCFHIIWQD